MLNKGQFVTLENLIYFGIGLSILIATVAGFNMVEDGIKRFSRDDQFKEVGELVLTNAQNTYIQGKNINSTYEVQFNVPNTLGDTSYSMSFEDNKELLVSALDGTNDNVTLSLMGLNESADFSGEASSIRGSVKIKYNSNGNIIIENP